MACSSFLSFYSGVWTGIQAASSSSSSDDDCVPKSGVGGSLAGLNSNGASSGGGCTAACLAEVAKENGELQRKVEVLAQQKVKEGEFDRLLR